MAKSSENFTNQSNGISRLLEVMARLRGEDGCPWDREQNHATLVPYLIEEAYELVEAIEAEGDQALCEELGDVLLQVVFHARIAEERGAFTFSDVAARIAEKLVTRHSHVFGGSAKLESPEEVRRKWHQEKMKARNSALEGVPSAQPAMHWARQIGARAAQTGFEWESTEQILDKVQEEAAEVRQAIQFRKVAGGEARLEMELGDLLFVVMNLARWLKIDPDLALRRSTRKFIGRFSRMEKALHDRGESTDAQTAGQWFSLWESAKQGGEGTEP